MSELDFGVFVETQIVGAALRDDEAAVNRMADEMTRTERAVFVGQLRVVLRALEQRCERCDKRFAGLTDQVTLRILSASRETVCRSCADVARKERTR